MIDDAALIAEATRHAGEFVLAKPGLTAGSVACALRSEGGNLYTGICLDLACGIGFCAEHAAVAAMLLGRETRVATIVAVNDRGRILPPCGRCRELLMQIDRANRDGCRVLLPPDPSGVAESAGGSATAEGTEGTEGATAACRAVLLRELLPEAWMV